MSHWRAWLNRLRRRLWRVLFFRMLFGERSAGRWLAGTRISPSTCVEHEDQLVLADDVFIGHFNFIEASAGVRIGRGTQVTNFVSIVSHSTHRAVRVAAALTGADLEAAVIRAPITVGERCFIGPHSTIEAGSVLGPGTLVAAHSRVRGQFPAFAVLSGSPAHVVGDTRKADRRWLDGHPQWTARYDDWLRSVSSNAPGGEGQP